MNARLPEPCMCGAEDCRRCFPPTSGAARFDPQVEAEVHYLRYDTSVLAFERDLAEALGNQGIEHLALYLRRGDAQAIRDEINRLFDAYWSKQIRTRRQ